MILSKRGNNLKRIEKYEYNKNINKIKDERFIKK